MGLLPPPMGMMPPPPPPPQRPAPSAPLWPAAAMATAGAPASPHQQHGHQRTTMATEHRHHVHPRQRQPAPLAAAPAVCRLRRAAPSSDGQPLHGTPSSWRPAAAAPRRASSPSAAPAGLRGHDVRSAAAPSSHGPLQLRHHDEHARHAALRDAPGAASPAPTELKITTRHDEISGIIVILTHTPHLDTFHTHTHTHTHPPPPQTRTMHTYITST